MQHGPTRDIDNRGRKVTSPIMKNSQLVVGKMIIGDRHRIITRDMVHAKIILSCATCQNVALVTKQNVVAITAVKV